MGDDAVGRRAERADRLARQEQAQRRRREQDSARAQALIDGFVARAHELGIATEELTARPWSGRTRYRTGLVGWYLRSDRSVGLGEDGAFYLLVVPPVRFGRWRTVTVEPSPPPLQVGEGARDGESIALDALLQLRLDRADG